MPIGSGLTSESSPRPFWTQGAPLPAVTMLPRQPHYKKQLFRPSSTIESCGYLQRGKLWPGEDAESRIPQGRHLSPRPQIPSVWAAEQPLPATDLLLSWTGAAWPRTLPPHHQSSGARGPRHCYECLCSARCGRSTCWPNKRAVTVHLCPDTEVSFSITKQETGSRCGQAERWLLRLSPLNWGHSSEVTVSQLGAICSNK